MSAPLSSRYDVGLFDLDGVCYLGNDSIPHAPEEVNRAVAGDFKNAYVTNNASRPREDVAQQLKICLHAAPVAASARDRGESSAG